MTAQQSGPAGRHAQPAEPGLDGEVPPHGTDAAGTGAPGPGLYERETALAWTQAWQVLMLVAVVTFAVGLILLVWPKATVIVVAALLGASLLVSGIFRLVHGLAARDLSGGTRAAYVLIGLLAALAGFYCLRHIDVTVVLLAFIVGVFWTLHGIVDLSVAATSGPGTGRGLRAVTGVLSLAAGLIVMFWPTISLHILLWVMGIWLLAYGVMLGVMAFQVRHVARAALA
ncbi:MAG: HdeD family acid-resistance protein [Streptosporangiaceae bacterium]